MKAIFEKDSYEPKSMNFHENVNISGLPSTKSGCLIGPGILTMVYYNPYIN